MRWLENVEHMGEENCVRSLVRKPKEKGPLGRPESSWEYNVKMDAKSVGSVDLTMLLWRGTSG
jgi:hypothetical protein